MGNCKKQSCEEKFKTSIGGQALIEGILMRGPKKQAIVIRGKDGLITKVEELKLIKDKYPILGWPLIRGVVNFGSSMANGMRALMFSAEQVMDEDEQEEPSKFEKWMEKHFGSAAVEQAVIYFSVILGILFSVGLFIFLPNLLAGLLKRFIESYLVRNLIEGVLRIIIFLVYLILVSQMKDMKRVFAYHGAEHKTIRCYEAKLELTVENVRAQTRLHPRCGTSFLFLVIMISIVFFSLIRVENVFLRLAVRLALLPVVVSVSYEITRFVGRHDNRFTRILTAPGLWMQNFTTQEPDDSMIEVGIESVKLVIPENEGEDLW
ncbi:MAG: DUF1385 domain-containing protein [Oscillospiraceae bacterium]|nr:DUF1385 domain-containing protein [Oscillospiraceae bacterium]MBR2977932.1 DUF1385 domain-containing protein [Oscillospiraceae bacterium]MBR3850262.1 DUF1385 domain-containing protein [Oscillospiraceae bacterium]